MKKLTLRRKLSLTFALLCAIVLCCWGLFYLRTARELERTSQSHIAQVSDRVIDTMETTLLSLEHVAVALSANGEVKGMLLETNPLAYHQKVGTATQVLDAIYQPDGLIDDILIYDMEGIYSRLRGELGNTAASRVQFLVAPNHASQHIVVALEGSTYLGYVTAIFEGDRQLGYLVFLMRVSRLQELFSRYDESDSLTIGLAADNALVASNDSHRLGVKLDQLQADGQVYSVRQIGLTPFQVLVSDNGETVRRTMTDFFFAATLTIGLLLAMLLLFYRFLGKAFFTPMLGLMENAKQVTPESGRSLSLTGQEEFDALVEQINSMVARLEEHSRQLFEMQYAVQDAELDRQRALVIALKKQINAHFTVNTLSVIRRLNELGQNQKAGEMCQGLSMLLRYAHGAEDLIGGLEELRILEKYVDIMQIRYPDRIAVVYDIDDRLDDLYMPRMLVQPLIENAIVHGLLGQAHGELHISARVQEERLVFCIGDNGRGIDPQQLSALRDSIRTAPTQLWDDAGLSHIALPNVQKRVISQFGEAYGLTVDSTPRKGTQVTLTLPICPV